MKKNTMFIVHWVALRGDVQARGGYYCISAPGRLEARRRAREGAVLERGEKFRITSVHAACRG